jgi:hypothetical protein
VLPAALVLPSHGYSLQHTSASVSIRQHTSAYACRSCTAQSRILSSAYVSIRQHTSAYVSIRQHTSAYVCLGAAIQVLSAALVLRIRCASTQVTRFTRFTSAQVQILTLNTGACACPIFIFESSGTSAYVSIRQHTLTYADVCSTPALVLAQSRYSL